jgi:SAM-dependent methyltransferase
MYIFQPDRILLKEQVCHFAKYIKGKCLDIGAGSFSRYEELFQCKDYIKMDIFPGKNVDVIGRAEAIPFEDDIFDSIVCTQVFEHLKNPFGSAVEFFRVLKKGGVVLLTVPQINELHEEPDDYFRYTKYGIEEIFREAGFKIIEMEQRGGFFTTIAQLKIRYLIDRFKLYKRPLLGKIFNQFIKVYARIMMRLDKFDRSTANRKHALGWCAVFKKPS